MTAVLHYNEEVLAGMTPDAAAADLHLTSCGHCSGRLQSIDGVAGAINDSTVWDERELSEEPKPRTAAMLRAFAARTKAEDASAGPIVARLLAAPAHERQQLLSANPEWRTAGVVRKILEAVDKTNFVDPKAAAEWAELASDVAELLEAKRYPFDAIAKLRATAWTERAYALFYVGSYPESLAALDHVEESLSQCAVPDHDRARALMYRAYVYRLLERYDEALTVLGRAKPLFVSFADRSGAAKTDNARAMVLISMRRFADALAILLRVAEEPALDEESRACALHNAGECYRELSRFEDAKRAYGQAILSFETLGLIARRAIVRWSLARAILDEGNCERALSMFLDLKSEFEESGMAQDVALVSLHAADALLALHQPSQVADLCRSSIEYFRKAGLAYSESAMTALAYLREAAEQGTITPAAVNHVRSFIEVLPKQPELLFAYPA